MEQQRNLRVNKLKTILLSLTLVLLFNGCTSNNLIDVNMEVPDNSWMYAKSVRATLDIKDSSKGYNVFFKIRNTADYRYANIYVIARLKGNTLSKSTRYQFQLAKADGSWLGKGSGNLYSNTFPLLKDFHFPKAGNYVLEVEQNMRDNPLVGVSDIGLTVDLVNP
ncbi:gliding motility lipoprotein GldH [Pedobacter insulae]|uniref:Gliding motility-associated lipoprotein GldH n=1 Tax=Pedobacter insulae TaxID=414048 RepID=A0A1I2XB68_9SPHI|nr:gliding motility lipoprotein GldH [Pedobacter insulae]SFH09241.1 gliding motility-associated lipoprotein GldH [Pedobacter insulae]